MLHWLESGLFFAQGIDSSSIFVQYGALGAFLLVCMGGIKVLFQREAKSLDIERQRVERLEDELRQLNASIHERYVPVLARATEVIAEALKVKREDL